MLWLEGFFGPFEGGVELHSHEIADLAVYAVPDIPLKLLLGRFPPDLYPQWNGSLHLQASPRGANVFQKCRGALLSARAISPANFDHIRAQHSAFPALLL